MILGLLLNVNFSQEKLSLYSLMLVFDTMGTSSPEMVPAVGGKEFVLSALTFSAHLQAGMELYWLKRIIMKTLTSPALVSSYYHSLRAFDFLGADRTEFYCVITHDPYSFVMEILQIVKVLDILSHS